MVDALTALIVNDVFVTVEIEANTPDMVEKAMNGATNVDNVTELPVTVDTLVFA